jgi:hypothetical protein
MQINSVKRIHFKSTLQAATTCPACHYHPIEVQITGQSAGSVIKAQVCKHGRRPAGVFALPAAKPDGVGTGTGGGGLICELSAAMGRLNTGRGLKFI